jgi:hydroxyacylglutathione hydrolase
MKIKKCLVLACFMLGGIVALKAQVFKNDDLQITLLEDRVWIGETRDNGTLYIIEGNDKALLIDTGSECDSLDKIVRLITQKPLQVVITHAHHDHDGSIGFFGEIYMHPGDTVLFPKTYKGKVNFIEDGTLFDLGGKIYRGSSYARTYARIDNSGGQSSGLLLHRGLFWLRTSVASAATVFTHGNLY